MSFKAINDVLIVGLFFTGVYIIYKVFITKAQTPLLPVGSIQDITNVPGSTGFLVAVDSLPDIYKGGKVNGDPNDPNHHLWIFNNSYMLAVPNPTTLSDTITVTKNNGVKINPKNKLIYLFACFSKTPNSGGAYLPQGAMAELDIFCDVTGDYFSSVFQGNIEHRFKMPVVVGHKYQRTMLLNFVSKASARSITYTVKDLNTGQSEQFTQAIPATAATGPPYLITHEYEYHNNSTTGIFPLRFNVVTSAPVYK